MDKNQSKVAYIERHFRMDDNPFSENKILSRSFQNVTFIIGEPGIGKSTTLSFLASKFDNKIVDDFSRCPHFDLTDQKSDLYQSPIDYFLRRAKNNSDDLEKAGYEEHQTDGNLGIFLDGFDDIFRFYGEKTLGIIREVLKGDCSVFITSTNEALSGYFKGKSNVMVEFDDKQRNAYLEYFNLSEEHAQKNYLRIPLHLEMYCKVHDKISTDSLVDFSLVDLYHTFIKNEIDGFCKHFSEDDYQEVFKKFMGLHQHLAIVHTFGQEFLIEQGIMTEDEITSTKETFNHYSYLLIGLIQVVDHDRIVFVHNCYSEYLTAEWLYSNDNFQITASIFKCQKHQRIADFFNQISNSTKPNPAISAIISGDLDKIRMLCHDEDDCLVTPDDLGRYPVHIAAWYSQYNRLYAFFDVIKKYTKVNNRDVLRKKDIRLKLTCADYINIRSIDFDMTVLKEIESMVENGVHPDTIFINEKREINQNRNSYYDDNALIYSIRHKFGGDTAAKLLQKGAHLETEGGQNAIFVALNWIDSPEPLEVLLKYAGNQIKIDDFLQNAAYTRTRHADEKIKLLLEYGANPHVKDDMGREALHTAVLKKNRSPIPKVKTLLEYGANPNHYDDDGETSLHIAASSCLMWGYLDQMEILLNKGGDPNLQDKHGRNVLHLASTNPLDDTLEAMKLIIKKISDINAIDNQGKPSLHYAAGYPYGASLEKVKILLENGANPTLTDHSGKNALHHAACSQNNSTEKVRVLLNLLDRNQLDLEGKSALHLASGNQCPKSTQTVKLLLENDANPCIKDHDGKSCLHYANSIEKAKMLLDNGANPKELDNMGRNCLHHAALTDSDGCLDTLKLFLQVLDVSLPDNNGETALHHAALSASNDSCEKLEVLLKGNQKDPTGLDLNKTGLNTRDNTGKHCLFSAVSSRRHSLKKIMLLLRNGALPNLMDVEGKTCLHYMATSNTYDGISQAKVLLKYGGDIIIKDNDGKTCGDYCNPDTALGKLLSPKTND